jgi:hypothetical protein
MQKAALRQEPSKLRPETRSTRGMSEICTPEILSAAPAVDALGPVVLAAQHSHSHGQQPCKIKELGMPLFTHTLPNVGNTCFFNSVLQVIASISSFVAEIEKAPLPPNFDDSSYCLAFLKLFIPAIAAPSSEPSIKLDMSSVTSGDWRMCHADWVDFVLRLTTKYDTKYALGAFADPGDLLDYFLSIVPGAERMCSIDFKWITTLRCKCQEQQRELTVRECGITLSVDSDATLTHHILRAFSPDNVCGYRCDQCQAQSSSDCPATRQRLLLSLPRFLRINITASLTSEALPVDFHRHGPLREYETLDLSQLTPQPLSKQAHYTLRAAIMYSARHHWTYLHGPTPIYVSDDTSRVASPQDIQMVALCARILIRLRANLPAWQLPPSPDLVWHCRGDGHGRGSIGTNLIGSATTGTSGSGGIWHASRRRSKNWQQRR